jgi:gp16 family phage-associated protein
MQTTSLSEIRELFEINGESIAQWARLRGYSPALVYRVMRGETKAKRGQTHEIAIALGLKRLPTQSEKAIFQGGPFTDPVHPHVEGSTM